ncbi:MAG TPA: ROK family protein [Petrotogaceae bacterium]|nr:ROK family protein [Petrotogaceae bacterium]HQF32552.1 ROK family protein [Petrotogaceae bacterium]HQH33521.1 ROK family protein [Petrotogaceae bacterium]HQI78869.1 ROK family protein [Petrotogaceae bacterium]
MQTIGSKELIREINEKLILKEIYLNKKIDRTSLIKNTGLSGGTITKIISCLIEKQLVKEIGEADSTGGRKPILLVLNKDYARIIGIKIGVGYIDFILTDLTGDVIFSQTVKYEGSISPQKVVSMITEFHSKFHDKQLLGISVAVSGIVNPNTGTVVTSFLLGWKDVELAQMIKKEVDTYIFVVNDVDSFSLSQLYNGNARFYKNSVVMTLGVGIGGSLIIDKKIHTADGGVGEIGHMSVVPNGNKCTCGSRGCLEAESSIAAIAARINKATTVAELKKIFSSVSNTEISELEFIRKAIDLDNKACKKVFKEFSVEIGIAMKNLINILAPDYFLLGGETLEFRDLFMKDAIEFAKKNAFGTLGTKVCIETDTLGRNAWTLGGIYKIIEVNLFENRI